MNDPRRFKVAVPAWDELPAVTRTFDETKQAYRYQYGDNPDAAIEVTLDELEADVDGACDRVGDWLETLDRREAQS